VDTSVTEPSDAAVDAKLDAVRLERREEAEPVRARDADEEARTTRTLAAGHVPPADPARRSAGLLTFATPQFTSIPVLGCPEAPDVASSVSMASSSAIAYVARVRSAVEGVAKAKLDPHWTIHTPAHQAHQRHREVHEA
jgi:hypothetical protein